MFERQRCHWVRPMWRLSSYVHVVTSLTYYDDIFEAMMRLIEFGLLRYIFLWDCKSNVFVCSSIVF